MTVPVDLAALLSIDPDAAQPPFEQLRLSVIELVSDGTLLVGSRVPTVRALAAALHLAPNTVARSYRELEAAGVLETRGRHGSYIKAGTDTRSAAAARAAVEFVTTLREMAINDADIVDLVRRATGTSSPRV